MFEWFRKRKDDKSKPKLTEPLSPQKPGAIDDQGEPVVYLQGREISRHVVPVTGLTVLELAERNGVDWNSFCKRGTCARCRCQVSEGLERLSAPNEAEENRLDPEEIEEGYRLGCQVKLEQDGPVSIRHAPYF